MLIATKVLKLREGENLVEIPIRIFQPEPDGGPWKCRFEIGWPDGKLDRHAMGEDSMQALVLALQMIGAILYTSEQHRSGKLFSEEGYAGYGFPVMTPIRDLLVGEDKKYL